MPAGRPKSKLRLLMEELIDRGDPLVSKRVYIKFTDKFLEKQPKATRKELQIFHEKLLNRIRFNSHEIKKREKKHEISKK